MPMLGFERHEIIEAIVEGFAGRDLSFLEAPPETPMCTVSDCFGFSCTILSRRCTIARGEHSHRLVQVVVGVLAVRMVVVVDPLS
jgi:hypothetical protein